MSWDYYKSQGYFSVLKNRDISTGAVNQVIWTPTASMRIIVNSLSVTSNLGGTIAFFFGGNQQVKISQYSVVASTTIYPGIEAWESTAIDAPFYCVTSQSGTNGWNITTEGFEIE